MPATNKFLFAFRKVERQAVSFCERCGEEHQSSEGLEPDIPAEKAAGDLLVHDVFKIE
ncbi:MAG UNVERIFIED_CONTAM: hypothetical protein LVR18_24020 [Planctomycetaceae bacterium]